MIKVEATIVCKTSKQHVYNQTLEVKWSLVGHRIQPPTICDVCGDPVGFLELIVSEVKQDG